MDWRKIERELVEAVEAQGLEVTRRDGDAFAERGACMLALSGEGCPNRADAINLSEVARRLADTTVWL